MPTSNFLFTLAYASQARKFTVRTIRGRPPHGILLIHFACFESINKFSYLFCSSKNYYAYTAIIASHNVIDACDSLIDGFDMTFVMFDMSFVRFDIAILKSG